MAITKVRGGQIKSETITNDQIKDGSITDSEIVVDSLTTTIKGNTFNGADQLVELLSDGKIPVLDGSNLTGLSVSESIGTIDLTDVEGVVNAANGLVKLDATGALPTLDGSALTNLPTGTGDLRADGTVPLTANWDVGSFTITAGAFVGDGSGLTGLPGSGNFVDLEEPTGLKNGSNTNFTLSNTPTAGSLHLFFNGIVIRSGAGNDYTISGSALTMVVAPPSGSTLLASYRV